MTPLEAAEQPSVRREVPIKLVAWSVLALLAWGGVFLSAWVRPRYPLAVAEAYLRGRPNVYDLAGVVGVVVAILLLWSIGRGRVPVSPSEKRVAFAARFAKAGLLFLVGTYFGYGWSWYYRMWDGDRAKVLQDREFYTRMVRGDEEMAQHIREQGVRDRARNRKGQR